MLLRSARAALRHVPAANAAFRSAPPAPEAPLPAPPADPNAAYLFIPSPSRAAKHGMVTVEDLYHLSRAL